MYNIADFIDVFYEDDRFALSVEWVNGDAPSMHVDFKEKYTVSTQKTFNKQYNKLVKMLKQHNIKLLFAYTLPVISNQRFVGKQLAKLGFKCIEVREEFVLYMKEV